MNADALFFRPHEHGPCLRNVAALVVPAVVAAVVASLLSGCPHPPQPPADPPVVRDQVVRAFDLAIAGASFAHDAGAAAGNPGTCAAGAVVRDAAVFGRGVFVGVDDLVVQGRAAATFPGPSWDVSACFQVGPRGDLRPEVAAAAASAVGLVGAALDLYGPELRAADCDAAVAGRQVVAWIAVTPDAAADVFRRGGLAGRFPDLVVDLAPCRP